MDIKGMVDLMSDLNFLFDIGDFMVFFVVD